MTANTKATNNTKAAEPLAPAFDPLALLAEATAALELAAPSKASKGQGAAAVPIAPIGEAEHLSALAAANLQPIQGAADHITRYGGIEPGTIARPRPVRRRTATQTAAYGLLGVLPCPVGHCYRMALALTAQSPTKPVEPEQLLLAMAAQSGRAVTVTADGTVALADLPKGKRGESRILSISNG